jgi:hypothetical protein
MSYSPPPKTSELFVFWGLSWNKSAITMPSGVKKTTVGIVEVKQTAVRIEAKQYDTQMYRIPN